MQALIFGSEEAQFGMNSARAAFESGHSALEIIEAGIRAVEVDPRADSVGYGGAPNILGQMECDACIMDGDSLSAGSVGALQGYKYPISVAAQVMKRLPHVMLVGQGAARFASEIGAEQTDMLSPESKANWEKWLAINLPGVSKDKLASLALAPSIRVNFSKNISSGVVSETSVRLGTVTFLVFDNAGTLGGGVSTSGWAYKYPGRLGDSPIIGAGMYVDSRYGGAACTHTGEMTIRAGTARAVVAYLKKGASVRDAGIEALKELLSLKGGFLGAVVLQAVDKAGNFFCGQIREVSDGRYWIWREGDKEMSPVVPELIS